MNASDQITQLWTAHHEKARAYVARRAGTGVDQQVLEDALGDAAEILTRSLQSGHEIHTPIGWLCTIAWHQYVAIVAAADRARAVWADGGREEEITSDDDLLEAITARETATELGERLATAVDGLTDHQRGMLVGFYEGMSYDELALRHGVSWGSVSKALTRARTKLADDSELRDAFTEWSRS